MNSCDQRPPSQALVERVQALDPRMQQLLLFILCTAVPGVVAAELDALEVATSTPARPITPEAVSCSDAPSVSS